jgi:adenylosuccinate synthase
VALKSAVQINSISGLCLTKLDVLDGLDEISVCIGYTDAGGQSVMGSTENYADLNPVYEQLPGWDESTVGAQRVEDLPLAARNYIARVEELVGAPIDIISTGPDRAETIVLRSPYA